MRLLRDFRLTKVLADKGDSDAFIEKVNASGAVAVIPGRKNSVEERDYDKTIYKERNTGRATFSEAKSLSQHSDTVRTISEKLPAMRSLVAIIIWLA